MYQNSLFYLQQGSAYVVEQEENSIFLLSNSLAFTLRPQDLGSKINLNIKNKNKNKDKDSIDNISDNVLINKDKDSNNLNKSKSKLNSQSSIQLQQQDINSTLTNFEDINFNFKSFPIELVRFKNSHYSYPLVRTSINFSVQEFYNSHSLLKFNRAFTSARIVKATKGGFLCLICGILGFLPKTHSPRFIRSITPVKRHKQHFKSNISTNQNKNTKNLSIKFNIQKKIKGLELQSFKTLYSFSSLCEHNFFLSFPCRYLSRVIYPPKFVRGKFQFNFIFTSLPLKVILQEYSKEFNLKNNYNSNINFKNKNTSNLKKNININKNNQNQFISTSSSKMIQNVNTNINSNSNSNFSVKTKKNKIINNTNTKTNINDFKKSEIKLQKKS